MFRRSIAATWITGVVLAGAGSYCSRAENLTQDFETWGRIANAVFTTNQDWVIHNGAVWGGNNWKAHNDPTWTNAAFLQAASTTNDTWLRSPVLTNGVGFLSFWIKIKYPGTLWFDVQSSTTGTNNWATNASYSYSSETVWTNIICPLSIYAAPLYLRIFPTADTGGGSSAPRLAIDDVSMTNPPARVLISGTGAKTPPQVLKPIDVECTLNPSSLSSNITATCYWHVAATSWQGIQMATNAQGKWQTVTSIPPQPTEDTLSYCVTVWFQGNDPMSPTNDPPGGTNSPKTVAITGRAFSTAYASFSVTGNFATAMYLFRDYSWQGVSTTSTVNGVFGFSGVTTNTAVTNKFGDANQDDFSLPIPGVAESNAAPIQVPGASSGQFLFRLDESNLAYSARQCLYQNFDAWSEGTYTADSNSGWVVYNSQIAQNPLSYHPGGSPYRSCFLDTNGFSAIRSPPLPDGIGEVSFYYRNSATNPATSFAIQKSCTGSTNASDWVTIASQPGIVNTNYTRYSFSLNDRYCNYIRILNSTNPPCGVLCLDEVVLANAGAGVWFTNVVVNPSPPACSDPVTLSCDVLLMAGASNRVVTAWYRSGTSGTFTAIGMTNAGNTFVTTNPIPAGMGDLGSGVGAVQYYFTCTFDGYESEYAGKLICYPEAGSNNATYFTVIPAQVAFSNVITVLSTNHTSQDIPVVGSNIYIVADIIPFAGAEWVAARLYYRIGTDGAFAPVFMDPTSITNHYVSRTPIPAQSFSGTPVQYYIEAYFFGPMAMSPTNYPAAGPNGPLTFVFRTPTYPSGYTNLTVSGTFNTNLTLIGPYEWQGLVATNSTAGRPAYRFNAFSPSGNTNWGDANQVLTNWPAFGVAEGGATNIVSSNASGNVLFRFNESNREYSVQQRCAYMNFDNWDTGAIGLTNGEWIIADGQTVTTPAYRAQGRSCVLSTNPGFQYVRSCYLTNGVGEVNLWYRNLQTNGAMPASFSLETSVDGTNSWRTATTVTNILTMDYLHYTYTLCDTNKHFLRILSGTNSPRASLCLDEIIIAPPGPGVAFANVTNTPANPTISMEVTISSLISPAGGSTNITAWVWYRAATNGNYESTPMTNSGASFSSSPPIPKGPVGNIQYYIECAFTGFRSNEQVHVTYPADGAFSPLSYSNAAAGLVQDFETWGRVTDAVFTTNQDWVIHNGAVWGGNNWKAHNDPPWTNAAFLQAASTTNDTWLRSPVLTNGVGFLSFWIKIKYPGTLWFDVQSSTTGTNNWATNASYSYSSEAVWTNIMCPVNIYDTAPVYLRIFPTADTGGGSLAPRLGLDDVSISPPPATVAISDVMRHPYYPCTNDPVYISCTITSSSPIAYAMNITGRVCYRYGSAGDFSAPIEMTRFGDTFITSQAIPPSTNKVDVEYYIESTFQGYHFNDSVSFSPTYAPAGVATGSMTQFYSRPTSGFFTYPIRFFASDYAGVLVAVSVTNVSASMLHVGDNNWQGVINFPTATANPWFSLQGLGYDTDSGPALTNNLWGDPGQSHSELPFAGVATLGATNFLLPGDNFGQYLIRFNESTRIYTIQRCVFQDFDLWQAPPDIFANSVNRIGIGTASQGFDAWPLSTANTGSNDWSAWSGDDYVINGYPYAWAQNFWVANGGLITNQVGKNKACQFHPDPDVGGPLVGAFAGPDEFCPIAGIGSFSLLYRCVDTNQPPTFNYKATNFNSAVYQAVVDITDFPTNADGSIVGLWNFSMFFRYVDANNYYEYRVEQDPGTGNGNGRWASIWRCRGGWLARIGGPWGIGSARAEKARLTAYVYNYGVDTDRVDITTFYNGGWCHSTNDDDTVNNIRTPGAIGFYSKDADIVVDDVVAGGAQFQHFERWSTSGYDVTSTNGEWRGYNAWMCTSWDERNWRDDYCANLPMSPPGANIRSGLLPQGVGDISWRAKWAYDMLATPPALHIQKSSDGVGSWTDLWSGDINATSFQQYSTNFNETGPIYIRFLATTNSFGGGASLFLDDIYIQPNTNATGIMMCTFDAAASTNEWTAPEGEWYWADPTGANGSYNCKGYNGDPLTFKIQTAPNPHLALPWSHNYPYDGEWSVRAPTNYFTRSGCTNTHYETASFTLEAGENICIRAKHTAGYGSLVVDNLNVTSWRGSDHYGLGWTATESWVTRNAWRTNSVELLRSRSAPSGYTNQYVMSPALTNGIGLISLRSCRRDGSPVVTFDLRIAASASALFSTASTVMTVTNSATNWSDAQAYTYYNAGIKGTHYAMIMHTTTNLNAGLLLDDISISDYYETDSFTWRAENALIAATNRLRQTEYGNVKAAYLNNDPTDGTVPPPIYTNGSYIQSALLTNGIGEISFWYRAWDATPAGIRIAASPGTNSTAWITLTNLYNITNTEYRQYTFMTYDTSNHYMRIYGYTNTATGRVCLDDLLITAPFGADVKLRNVATTPAVPVDTNTVYFTVELYDFFAPLINGLFEPPRITAVTAHYRVGTNSWGTWIGGASIPMTLLDDAGTSQTYRTAFPLGPTNPVGTVIQYYVDCSLVGLFGDKVSPKRYRTFTNPSWYEPRNINTEMDPSGKTSTPYYIVFSCPPKAVWINEIHYSKGSSSTKTNEYVELCGPSGTSILGWRIELIRGDGTVRDYTVVSNSTSFPYGTIPSTDTTNGFGFFVFGDPGVANVDQVFTNPADDNLLPPPAGVRLVRSMGAYEYRLCYGSPVIPNFVQIVDALGAPLTESSMRAAPLFLWGSGNSYSNFNWTNGTGSGRWYSPGTVNSNQVFTGEEVLIYTVIHHTLKSWIQYYYGSVNYDAYDTMDTDGDGQLTWQEYTAGTIPTDSNSVFEILDIRSFGASNRITFSGSSNSFAYLPPFGMLRTTNLMNSASWSNIGTVPRSSVGTNVYWDQALPSNRPAFYRPVASNSW